MVSRHALRSFGSGPTQEVAENTGDMLDLLLLAGALGNPGLRLGPRLVQS